MPKPIKLDGPGKIVKLFKVKYIRGSGLKRKQIWIFGLVERKPLGKCLIQVVPIRKAEHLLQKIYDHVHDGTLIVSDSWSSLI